MQIFVMGLTHTQTTVEFTTCAFTMKVWNLCRMLHDLGHEIIHLGTEGSNPVCTEHVSVTPYDMWKDLYGKPGSGFYKFDVDGKYAPYQQLYVDNARNAIKSRMRSPWESIICVTWGDAQRWAVETPDIPQHVVESGIGYKHTFAKHRVFESYAWMHMLYGVDQRHRGEGWYDVVIPNAFDPSMFTYKEKKDNYFLYLGRLNDDKGIYIARDLASRTGIPLKIVGQGNPDRFLSGSPFVTYHPPVGVEERRELLANAKALICPTIYVEPFGGVAVEAQISGTPVICTDWGGFSETVCHGYTGYRCRNMSQFLWAANNIDRISPAVCRKWAMDNFSLDRIGKMYDEYFHTVADLKYTEGWYYMGRTRTELDWLKKEFPH